jgi:deoxycytidylate deaminase
MLHKFLKLARVVSMHSSYRIRMGCVIVEHGKPIAIGFNVEKSSPKTFKKQATIHAEIDAITTCKCDVRGAIIYVYREHKNGLPAMARPCANCMAILAERGIKRMIYSINTYPYYIEEKL